MAKTAAEFHAEADRILAGIDLQKAAANGRLEHKWMLIQLLAHAADDQGMRAHAEAALDQIKSLDLTA